jgi:hypothetical protein
MNKYIYIYKQMPPTRRQREESSPTTRRTTRTRRTDTQQQLVQVEEARPFVLPPVEHVRQNATLEHLLQYPELIFYDGNTHYPYHNDYNILTDAFFTRRVTQEFIEEIRNKVLEHPEKEQEITDLLRTYIQKIRELRNLEIGVEHAESENERVKNSTRIPLPDGRTRADPSRQALGMRNRAFALVEQARVLVSSGSRELEELEERIVIALFGEQGARERREAREAQFSQDSYYNDYDSGDEYDSDGSPFFDPDEPIRIEPLPAGPLPAQRVNALPPLPQGFKQSELPNINIAEQCNGETDSPINMEPLESDKTVKLSDGKCYSFDDIALLYRMNHRDFKSPFSRQKFTKDDINIARTLIEKGYGKTEGGRKSKKARKTRKSKKARKTRKSKK